MPKSKYSLSVFINCPFDKKYDPLRNALLFAIMHCGFIPRCALEEDNGLNVRIDKIKKLIEHSKYSIHDISRIEIDQKTRLPRFNMPLELGIFLGAKFFGEKQHQKKNCLILDKKQYRYHKFMSDIAGQDIGFHNNNMQDLISNIRNWLNTSGEIKKKIPGGAEIYKQYKKFSKDLPAMCKDLRLKISEKTYNDHWFDYSMD